MEEETTEFSIQKEGGSGPCSPQPWRIMGCKQRAGGVSGEMLSPSSPLLEEMQREVSAFTKLKGRQKAEGSSHVLYLGDITLLSGLSPTQRAPEEPSGWRGIV